MGSATSAFIAACIWVIVAWVLSVVLTAKQSWPAAYGLIALGLPILIWLGLTSGWITAVAGFVVGCIVLRWPVIYASRWVKRRFSGE